MSVAALFKAHEKVLDGGLPHTHAEDAPVAAKALGRIDDRFPLSVLWTRSSRCRNG